MKDAPIEKELLVKARALEALLPHGAASLELIGALIERVKGEEAFGELMLAHASVVDVACVAVPLVLERISRLIKLCLVDLNTQLPKEKRVPELDGDDPLEIDLVSILRHCEKYDHPALAKQVLELTRNLFPLNPQLVPGCSLPKTNEQAELELLMEMSGSSAVAPVQSKIMGPSKKGAPVLPSKTKPRK